MKRFIQVSLWGLLAGLLAACGGLAGEPVIVATVVPRPTVDVASVMASVDLAQGASIFAEHCTDCHGTAGKGDGALVQSAQIPAPPDFTLPATIADISLDEWFGVIRDGRLEKMMPPWGNSLSETEIWAVAAYTYQLSSGEAIVAAPSSTEEAAAGAPAESTAEAESAVAATAIPEVLGVVHGTLTNGTPDAPITGEISIGLHILDHTMNEIDFRQVMTSTGDFTFTDVPLRADRAYQVSLFYQNVWYFSEPIIPDNPQTAQLELPVTIYDSAEDPSAIRISLLLTQIEKQATGLIFSQVIQFTNISDKAYIGANPTDDGLRYPSVQFTMPEGANLLANQEMIARYVIGSDNRTVFDTEPVLPGKTSTMHLTYTLPTQAAVIEYPIPYDMANQVEVMLPPNQFDFTSAQLQSQGVQQFANGTYEDFLGLQMQSGQILRYELRPIVPTNPNLPLAIGLTVAGVGMLALSAVLFWQTRLENRRLNVQTQQEKLIQQMGDLDIQFQKGKIKEKVYQQRRDALKARLEALMQQKS